jgi:hypothetical protein
MTLNCKSIGNIVSSGTASDIGVEAPPIIALPNVSNGDVRSVGKGSLMAKKFMLITAHRSARVA